MSLTPMGDVMVAIKADVDDYQKAMATASDSTGMLTSSFRSAANMARTMGAAMTAVGGIMGAAVTGLVSKANRFQKAMDEVNTLSDKGANAMERYGGEIQQLSEELGNAGGALELTEALYQSLSSGQADVVDKQMELIEGSAKLADITNSEVSTVLDATTSTLNAYNMEVGKADEVMNQLFGTIRQGKIRMDELANVFPRVAAMASNVGANMNEVLGGIAELTAQGFEPRVAGTAMRAMVRSIIKPSEAFRDTLIQVANSHNLLEEEMGEAADVIGEHRSKIADNEEQMSEWKSQIEQIKTANEDLSNEMRKHQIAIMEIRNRAMKQGRDLTAQEEREIERRETKKRELRMQQQENRIEQHELNKKHEEAKETNEELSDSIDEILEKHDMTQNQIGQTVVKNLGLVETFRQAQETGDDMGYSLSELIPETRALNGAMGLLNDGAQGWAESSELIGQRGEYTREQLQQMVEEGEITEEQMQQYLSFEDVWEDNVADKAYKEIQRAKNAAENAAMDTGEIFQDIYGDFMQWVADTFKSFRDWLGGLDQATQDAIAKFTMFAAGAMLILGPLLLIGGQLALIVGTMGTALIPVLGILAVVAAVVGGKLKALAAGGEEAQKAADDMREKFWKVVDFFKYLKSVIKDELLGPIITLGKGIYGALKAMAEGFAMASGAGEDGQGTIRKVASAIGDLLQRVGEWLQRNQHIFKQIGRLAGALAKILGPALINLAKAIWGVIEGAVDMLAWILKAMGVADDGESSFGALASGIIAAAKVVAWLINGLAKIINFLQPVLSAIVLVGAALYGLGAAVSYLAGTFGGWLGLLARYLAWSVRAVGVKQTLISAFHALRTMAVRWFAAAKTGGGIIGMLTRGMTFLTKVLGGVIKGFKFLGGRFLGVLGKAWKFIKGMASTRMSLLFLYAPIQALISLFGLIASSFKWAADQIVEKAKWLYKILVGSSIIPDLMSRMYEIIIGGLVDIANDAYEKGKAFAETLANGIKKGAGAVEGAVNFVAEEIDKRTNDSDAEVGPLSNTKASGRAFPETLGQGIRENADAAANAADFMAQKTVDRTTDKFTVTETDKGISIGKKGEPSQLKKDKERRQNRKTAEQLMGGMNPGLPGQSSGMPQTGTGTKIEVSEKAIFFEEGAFEGIAEEEMPEKVRDEIEVSLDRILEDMEAKGQRTNYSGTSGTVRR